MKDDTHKLLEKIYSEFSARFERLEGRFETLEVGQKNLEIRQKNLEAGQKNLEILHKNLEVGQKNLEAGFQQLSNRISKVEFILEHDINNKLQALHEGWTANTAKLEEHGKRLDSIEAKIDSISLAVKAQDMRLKVVETSRKKAK